MTTTNRAGNRLLLALVGIVAIASGAWVLLTAFPDAVPALVLPELPTEHSPVVLWGFAVLAALAIAACVAWIVTRGRGRAPRVALGSSDYGRVEFDASALTDLLTASLEKQHDILSVKAAAFRARRSTALLVTVNARKGCNLPRLRDDVAVAIDQLDEALEQKLPVLLHVTSGVRATFAREQRVA